MTNKIAITCLTTALLLSTVPANADPDSRYYAGLQYGSGTYSEKNISKDFNPTALIGRFGYYFHPNFSVEGRVGFGVKDDTKFLREFGPGGLNARYELNSVLGVYGTAQARITRFFSLYGILGISNVDATVSIPGYSAADATSSDNSISYGIGANFSVANTARLGIEYTRYLDKTDYSLDMFSLGFTFLF